MSVCVVEGQRLSDVMRLGCSRDETAYHEAGHAAIELIYGFTPKLLLIKDRGGEISGDCFSCAPTGQEHAAWHGTKAVAGVLAQALYVAGQRLNSRSLRLPTSAIADLVQFFFAPPDATRSCVVPIVGNGDEQTCRVDLRGCYSSLDYQHFRVSVAELTTQQMVGSKFIGNESECRRAAEERVADCVNLLNDPFVWDQLSRLANALIQSEPVTAQLIERDGIERAAGLLSVYLGNKAKR
jgi:hypothetical protein